MFRRYPAFSRNRGIGISCIALSLALAACGGAGGDPGPGPARTPDDTTALGVISKDGAPDGGKCLRSADSPSFANRCDPHVYAKLNHDQGISTATFKVWIDAQAQLVHE